MLSKQKTKKLNKGDKVALITPAGPINEDELYKAAEIVKNINLTPVWNKSVLEKKGYLAGDDQARAEELMYFWEKTDIKALFCVRGGYGTTRILNLLDYKLITQNPKLFMGFSDITALNAALLTKANLVSLHGSLKSLRFSQGKDFFEKNIFSSTDGYEIKFFETEEGQIHKIKTIKKGKAQGELVGGNLSLLVSLIGTEYLPKFENKIVFIEEISEPPYKIDRMLTHLFMATDISQASGIVLGIFNKCRAEDYNIQNRSLTLNEIFEEKFSGLNIPVMYNFPFGHLKNSHILPYGTKVELDTGKQSILIKESITDGKNS